MPIYFKEKKHTHKKTTNESEVLSINSNNFTCQNYFSHFGQGSLNVHPIKIIVFLLRDKTLPTSPMQFATHQHTFLLKGIFPDFGLGKKRGGGGFPVGF